MKPAAALLWLAALQVSCGYRPVYGGSRPEARLAVVAAPHRTPRLEVVHSVMAGVRRELSEAGVLHGGSAYPRVVVEVLRVDELPTGMAAATAPDGERRPAARGSAVGVTARAWLVEKPGAQPVRDTGDVRRVEHVRVGGDARLGGRLYDDAARVAARRVGRALARRVLGRAEPAIEPM